MFIFFGSFFV